ncbi:MAG: hypothetical protein GXN99_01430 [Candidatus Nanohaloarchaeota archaeon]|nr:hypothetical protein [Candidatus Nanohaloarchaeota archaeon]
MLTIDGSVGEGGGQILRTTASLAAILQKDVKIINVRAKRNPPGLKAQHLHALKALEYFGIEIKAELGSKEVIIKGSKLSLNKVPKIIKINIGTAGSTNLVAQTLMPVLAYYNVKHKVSIKGGTDVIHAPSSLWMKKVYIPYLSKTFGIEFQYDVLRKGYYPKGGGEISIELKNASWQYDKMKYEEAEHYQAMCEHTHKLKKVCEKHKTLLIQELPNIIYESKEVNALSEGVNGIIMLNQGIGVDWVGEKAKPLEYILKERLDELRKMQHLRNPYNKWLCDQAMIWFAVYAVKTNSSLEFPKCTTYSMHAKTNRWVIEGVLRFG